MNLSGAWGTVSRERFRVPSALPPWSPMSRGEELVILATIRPLRSMRLSTFGAGMTWETRVSWLKLKMITTTVMIAVTTMVITAPQRQSWKEHVRLTQSVFCKKKVAWTSLGNSQRLSRTHWNCSSSILAEVRYITLFLLAVWLPTPKQSWILRTLVTATLGSVLFVVGETTLSTFVSSTFSRCLQILQLSLGLPPAPICARMRILMARFYPHVAVCWAQRVKKAVRRMLLSVVQVL